MAGQVWLVWNEANVCKQSAAWDSLTIPTNVYSFPPQSVPPPAAAMPVVTYADQHRACAKAPSRTTSLFFYHYSVDIDIVILTTLSLN